MAVIYMLSLASILMYIWVCNQICSFVFPVFHFNRKNVDVDQLKKKILSDIYLIIKVKKLHWIWGASLGIFVAFIIAMTIVSPWSISSIFGGTLLFVIVVLVEVSILFLIINYTLQKNLKHNYYLSNLINRKLIVHEVISKGERGKTFVKAQQLSDYNLEGKENRVYIFSIRSEGDKRLFVGDEVYAIGLYVDGEEIINYDNIPAARFKIPTMGLFEVENRFCHEDYAGGEFSIPFGIEEISPMIEIMVSREKAKGDKVPEGFMEI